MTEKPKPETPRFSSSRLAAMRMTEFLASTLDAKTVVAAYRDPTKSAMNIAKSVLPEYVVTQYPVIAENAVRRVLTDNIPPEEYQELVQLHEITYKQILRESGYYSSNEFRAQSSKAAHAKHAALSPNEKANLVRELLLAQGKNPWTDDEKIRLISLALNPEFQHTKGTIKGCPDYAKIAEILNVEFHDGEPKRNRNNVGNYLRTIRHKEKEDSH